MSDGVLPALLTGTWPLMMTSSAKRTLTGLDFNLALLAALMNADLGDFKSREDKKKRQLATVLQFPVRQVSESSVVRL